SVSRTCSSNESSLLVTQAIPPCAQAVLVSEPLRLVITATEPCFAAFNAKLRPAIPLPITTKSYSFMTVKQAILPAWSKCSNTQIGLLHHDVFLHPNLILSIKRVCPKNTATASNEFGLTVATGCKLSAST